MPENKGDNITKGTITLGLADQLSRLAAKGEFPTILEVAQKTREKATKSKNFRTRSEYVRIYDEIIEQIKQHPDWTLLEFRKAYGIENLNLEE